MDSKKALNKHLAFNAIILLVVGIIISIASYVYIEKTNSTPIEGGEYIEGILGQPSFAPPILYQGNKADKDIARLVYRSLVTYDKNGVLVGDLALSYVADENDASYYFTLRQDIFWSDGAPITSKDVVFTFQTIQNEEYNSYLFPIFKGVKIKEENEKEFSIKLPATRVSFIENMTVPIMPKHIWEKVDLNDSNSSKITSNLVGSGYFILENCEKTEKGFIASCSFSKNTKSEKVYLDKIIFKFYSNEKDALKGYKDQEIDGMTASPETLPEIKNQKSARIYNHAYPARAALLFNARQNSNLGKKETREALTMAINKERIISMVLKENARALKSIIPSTDQGYEYDQTENPPFDINEAKKILNDIGLKDEDGNGFLDQDGADIVFYVIIPTNESSRKVIEEVKKQWEKIGVKIEYSEQEDFENINKYDILLYEEPPKYIPDLYSRWHSFKNMYSARNERIDSLLEQARFEYNLEKRSLIYREIQKQIIQNRSAIFLYEPVYVSVVNKKVKGVSEKTITDLSYRFLDIQNWHIKTKRLLI